MYGCGGLLLALLASAGAFAQSPQTDTIPPFRSVAATGHYLPLLSQKAFTGQRYRLEWAIPVRVPVALLDTLEGGLRIDAKQSAHQSFTLYLHNAANAAYTLKPLVQIPFRHIPDIYQNTIIADFAADLGSAYHPYAPLTISILAHAAGLSYNPVQLVYLPPQKALGSFNPSLSNQLYYLQRLPVPADADTSATWVSTPQMLALLQKDSRNQVDAATYLRYRLLDMLLGISNRDAWSWHWLAKPTTTGTVYVPVPEGYESAYALYEGRLLTVAKILAPIKHLVPFEKQMPDPAKLNERSLHLDRRLTSSLDEDAWQAAAVQLRTALTDAVLQAAVQQMPAAVQTVSGGTIVAKLKSRRNALEAYAQRYYDLLAGKVDVLASEVPEQIRIQGLPGKGITISMYQLNEAGQPSSTPFFERTFRTGETSEINLYGVGGQDRFIAAGSLDKNIRLRIIGGLQQDSVFNSSRGGKLAVYDDRSNNFVYKSQSRFHLRNNTNIYRYDLDAFAFNKGGLRPMVFYNNNDRLFAGLTYSSTRQGWRKTPFAQRHKAYLNYSILQGGLSWGYEGVFNQFIGQWNGMFSAAYDAVRWNNFFGIGNETPPQVEQNDYYRVRSEIFATEGGLFRPLGRHQSIGITGRFQTVRIRPDMERFVAKTMTQNDSLLYRTHPFAGARITYNFQTLNNPLLPTKGVVLNARAAFTKNLSVPDREVMTYGSNLQFYVPLAKRLVGFTSGGVQVVRGRPEFYQLANIGGSSTLRGFRRERFWGKTAFYNQNELQYLIPFRSYYFNGTLGFMGLFDAGRVWQPGEHSDKLHTAYGAGMILSPFHKLRVSVAYARSAEGGMIHAGLLGNL